MNIKNWLQRTPPRQKSKLFEKVERIEDTVLDIQALLHEQAKQKTPQMQAVPRRNEDVAPFEDFEPWEEVQHEDE